MRECTYKLKGAMLRILSFSRICLASNESLFEKSKTVMTKRNRTSQYINPRSTHAHDAIKCLHRLFRFWLRAAPSIDRNFPLSNTFILRC